MLKFATIGFFQGAVYGLLAVGIVLVYKGTRVFNFAQAEFGSVAALLLFTLHDQNHVNYLLAVIIALAAVLGIGLAVERLIIRPLMNAPRVTLIVATVGVALFLISIELIYSGTTPRVISPAWHDPVNSRSAATEPNSAWAKLNTRVPLYTSTIPTASNPYTAPWKKPMVANFSKSGAPLPDTRPFGDP